MRPLPRRIALASATGLALLIVLTHVSAARACSMCSCGDPTYRIVGEEFFGASSWRLGLDLDRTGKDAADEDMGMREHESETRLTASAAWSPRGRLRLVGRVPLVQRRIATDADARSLIGLGDPEMLVHARITPGTARDWAAVMLGVRTPWGQNDRVVDGARADEHLQPGAGAVALWSGLSGAVRLGRREHLFASVMGRWSAANRHGYRYGDAMLANVAWQRDLAPRLAGVLELNARDARFDRVDGVQVANTGGSVLYLAPRAQWQVNEVMVLRLGVQVPVAQRMLGDQRERANLISGITLAY